MLSHSPQIVTNGLVFAYDMGNTKKSWKGAPTTNLLTNLANLVSWGNTNALITPNAALAPDGTFTANTVTFSSVSPIARVFQDTSVTSVNGVVYTSSIYLKSNVPATIILSVQRSGPLDVEGITCNVTTTWQRFTFTHSGVFTGNTSVRFAIYSYTSDVIGPTFYVWSPQLEVGSFATPFVNGTRSNTQSIVDMVGGNSITTTSLTYASDGTFSWAAGVDARLQAVSSNFAFGTGDFTLECWIKPVNFSGYTHMIALPDQTVFALKANSADGVIYFYSPAFTTYGSTAGWTLTANTWNHVIMTRSSSVAYCYLNGLLIGSKSGFTNSFTSQVLNIGNGFGNEYTAKSISSVKVYNRALSAAEVKQNYNALRGRYGI